MKKFNNIGRFIDDWQQRDRRFGSGTLMPDWYSRFLKAGYYQIEISGFDEWSETHKWCREQFGEDHYNWTGSIFWFETERDATFFALRWL